jgi:ADP-ribose pyrophosphatase
MAEDGRPPPWRVLARRRIVDDRWLRLDAERIEAQDGTIIEPWYLVDGQPWACAVAWTPDRQVVMIEQYRRGVDRWSLEIPAGNLDPGEEPAAAALRELLEETGYAAMGAPRHLGSWWPEPAHNSARAHGFAVGVAPEPRATRLDPGEHITVRLMSVAAVEAAIADGSFCHGVQIGFWYAARARSLP